MSRCLTPAGAVVRGLVAGIAGAAVMTGWQLLAAKLQSSEEDGGEQDDGEQDPWEQASVPAKVAKRIGEGVFQKEVPPELIGLLTNVMHWGYGTSWGAVYGVAAGGGGRPRTLRGGAAFGTAVWAMSYVQLVPMGLYEPPWTYPSQELALDLSYHLVYGVGVAAAFRAITP